jgi:branched-chain amino acid transport system ATP-binding protein
MLRVDQIDVFYGDAQALFRVSLEVNRGEIVTLVGSNGAGKSTTLRAISGLLRPRRGALTLDGVRMDRVPAHRIVSLGVAHVPEGRRLFPQMTVLENLTLGAFNTDAWKQRAETLESVYRLFPRLEQRSAQLAGTLSGGEQQMCAIGRALMSRPQVLLLDEPSLGLAPLLVHTIFEAIDEINKKGTTILLVEQNANAALKHSHRGYVLETGIIVMEGASQQLANDPGVKEAYLGE